MIENVKSLDYERAFIMGHLLGLEVPLLYKVLFKVFSYKNGLSLFHLNLAVCIFLKIPLKTEINGKEIPK